MPNLMIQPLKQERYNEQMNDGHVEFIQQANSQFTPYNDQVNASGTMLPSTATNQSLVIGQLGVVNDQSNIEHNEMEQSVNIIYIYYNALHCTGKFFYFSLFYRGNRLIHHFLKDLNGPHHNFQKYWVICIIIQIYFRVSFCLFS